MEHDVVDDNFVAALVRDAQKLILLLAVDVSGEGGYRNGTTRYKSVFDTINGLTRTQATSGQGWFTTTANGRTGDYLTDALIEIKANLEGLGEKTAA